MFYPNRRLAGSMSWTEEVGKLILTNEKKNTTYCQTISTNLNATPHSCCSRGGHRVVSREIEHMLDYRVSGDILIGGSNF